MVHLLRSSVECLQAQATGIHAETSDSTMWAVSQIKTEIPINCILTYKIICARSGILLSLTNQLIGMLLEITLTKKFE
jgi:hypothetical protein